MAKKHSIDSTYYSMNYNLKATFQLLNSIKFAKMSNYYEISQSVYDLKMTTLPNKFEKLYMRYPFSLVSQNSFSI